MAKQVLSVGQCGFDQSGLKEFFRAKFGAKLVSVDTEEEAVAELGGSQYDLVLVNRKLDRNGADGIAIIKRLKLDLAKETPVMLVSNYLEYQEKAMAAGAEAGFGKSQYNDEEAQSRIRAVLGEAAS